MAFQPINRGQKWNNMEEITLINELQDGKTLEFIAMNHGRNKGAIILRIQEIAYRMYLAGTPVEEILSKTRLDQQTLDNVIKLEGQVGIKKNDKAINDVAEMKKDIVEMKKDIAEMKAMISYFYKFSQTCM